MGAIDLVWHVLNLFAVPLGLGMVAATAVKLAWHRRLSIVRWRHLATAGCAGACAGEVAGLFVLGQDGRMAGYGATLVATALALWWVGFVRRPA